MEHTLDRLLELEKRENITYRQVIKGIKIVLDQIEGDNIGNDIENMNRSNFFSNYCNTKTHIKKESYLDSDCPWKATHYAIKARCIPPNIKGEGNKSKNFAVFLM